MLPLSPDDFRLFKNLLIEMCGLYFEEGRDHSLHLALWQRLQERGYGSYREYYHFLKFHPEGWTELRELLDLITIGETYFFRNKAQFDVLMKEVLPDLIQRKEKLQDKRLRIWSAGCSRGDEPYSIAIAIKEVIPYPKEWQLSILGTDINRQALASAKEALYEEKDLRHLPNAYIEKFFDVQNSTYALHSDVKKLVQFEYHNLARDSFFQEKMQQIDIIFCRNVTIYFDFRTTQRVMENFYHCLNDVGYLFLGHTETLWQITNKFERIEFPQTFIYQKGRNDALKEETKPFMAVPELTFQEIPSIQETLLEQRRPLQELKFSLSSSHSVMALDKNQILTSLTKATLLANEAKYEEAVNVLEKVIGMDNLNVEAYYLLGVLLYRNGQLKQAEAQFKKVIYVDPDSILAYFNLGNIYLYQRRWTEAIREFKNAIRLSERKPRDEQIRFCEDFTVEFLLRACRNNLTEISKRGERDERTGKNRSLSF